ncbi:MULTISPECIES: SDR family NAD(P)-dependent oxidoreductase [Streptomyces]|uniref:SDR family oxidoreductase n=1 Tax=Streptomyces siderophoricus TaxID=2802281 RepID=A0ABS1MTF0_9ACTN|nr:SDR family oxidoreductase [Streptomyces sp. 9-7]MBL1091014.1 SDR family oxidoreductase [Streptomyces sp. 9-7]
MAHSATTHTTHTTHTPETPPGRVVIITGAGTGIGRAAARAFAAEGARVLAVGRRAEPLAETAADVQGDGEIVPYLADITADDAPARLVRHAIETYGRLDVLVNNAAIVGTGALGSFTKEGMGAQLATNLVAPVLLTQEAVPHLERTGGVVVNISTSVGQRGWPGNAVYAATKTGLELLTRSWAVELAPRGVRVVAVAPGAIETPIGLHQGLSEKQRAAHRAWQIAHTPMGRIGRPEEVAWAITHLAAPSASFVTGVILPVDGGAVVG